MYDIEIGTYAAVLLEGSTPVEGDRDSNPADDATMSALGPRGACSVCGILRLTPWLGGPPYHAKRIGKTTFFSDSSLHESLP